MTDSIIIKSINDLNNDKNKIIFDDDFNDSLEDIILPNHITHITFGYYYNQSLENVKLPNSLTHITFGHDFNQSIGILPDSMQYLEFFELKKPLLDLPVTIKELCILCDYKNNLDKSKIPFDCKVNLLDNSIYSNFYSYLPSIYMYERMKNYNDEYTDFGPYQEFIKFNFNIINNMSNKDKTWLIELCKKINYTDICVVDEESCIEFEASGIYFTNDNKLCIYNPG